MKVIVVIPQSAQLVQVEVPASVEDRSVKGAIHIRPGVVELTRAEADFVLTKVPGAVIQPVVEVPVEVEAEVESEVAAEEPGEGDSSPRRRRRQ